MPPFNDPAPLGSPVPLASPPQPPAPTSSAITAEQLATIITPIVVQTAPVIALALANGLLAWLSASMPRSGEGGGVAPEETDA